MLARQFGFYENNGGGFVVASLSPENQVRLGDALAAYVAQHPDKFTEQAAAAAAYHLSLPGTGKPLARDGWTLEDFADALLEQASFTLPSIGNKLLIAAVIVAAVYFGVKAWASTPRPAAP